MVDILSAGPGSKYERLALILQPNLYEELRKSSCMHVCLEIEIGKFRQILLKFVQMFIYYTELSVCFIISMHSNKTHIEKNSPTATQNGSYYGSRKKQFHVIPINSSFLFRRVLESTTQIQDHFLRLQLADLFQKPLQINVGTRVQLQ